MVSPFVVSLFSDVYLTSAVSSPDATLLIIRYLYHLSKTLHPSLVLEFLDGEDLVMSQDDRITYL